MNDDKEERKLARWAKDLETAVPMLLIKQGELTFNSTLIWGETDLPLTGGMDLVLGYLRINNLSKPDSDDRLFGHVWDMCCQSEQRNGDCLDDDEDDELWSLCDQMRDLVFDAIGPYEYAKMFMRTYPFRTLDGAMCESILDADVEES